MERKARFEKWRGADAERKAGEEGDVKAKWYLAHKKTPPYRTLT